MWWSQRFKARFHGSRTSNEWSENHSTTISGIGHIAITSLGWLVGDAKNFWELRREMAKCWEFT